MACAKLQEYLDSKQVKYVSIKHSPAFTAQELAAATHIPGKEVAKTVVVKLDGELAMVVLPAPERVRMNHLRAETGAGEAVRSGKLPDLTEMQAETSAHADQLKQALEETE